MLVTVYKYHRKVLVKEFRVYQKYSTLFQAFLTFFGKTNDVLTIPSIYQELLVFVVYKLNKYRKSAREEEEPEQTPGTRVYIIIYFIF